jgi:hypothetical protein
MENNKELKILLYSLDLVGNFSGRVDSINSSEEFFKIHNRNIDSLMKLSKERNTDFFIEKIKQYPSFTENELIEYIRQKRKDKSLFSVLGGHLFTLIELLYKAAKTKGNNLGNTRAKLMDFKRINDSLIYVVQNPGFEELINNNV